MPRLTIFAKGNLDLRDSLQALRIGGTLAWNGVGEVIRERHPGVTSHVRHETLTRPDALLAATGVVPPELAARSLALGAYPAQTQFSAAFFDAQADVAVLSIQPSVKMSLWRRRGDGWLFMAENRQHWAGADLTWLQDGFDNLGPLEVEAAMQDLAAVIARRRAISEAPILIYNLCAAMPGEQLHVHTGFEDALSTRIRRFNLGLVELSQSTGVSIIDVDAILSRAGADRLRIDPMHLNADGCRLVADEVVRVLEDLGVFEAIA